MRAGLGARVPSVLRDEPQFRLLFWGQALSLIGDRITFVAMPFAVLSIGGGAAEVGLVAGAQTLPFLLFSLAAGVWADRLDRRRIMIASDLVRLACQALAGGLLLAGNAEPWHLALVGLAYGTGDAFFGPAMYGMLPQIVSPAHLQAANALRGMSMSVGLVLGPAAAGAAVATIGPGGALLADSATFAVSVLFLLRLRPAVAERAEPARGDFLRGLREGWREVRARSWVSAMLVGLGVYHAVVLPSVFVLGPVIADADYGGAGDWALVTAGFGVGSVAGQLLLLRWRPRRAILASATLLIGASCQAAIIGSGLPIGAIAGLEALAAVCVTGFFTLWETSIQEQVPDHAVSRVGSYDLFISVGFLPLGAALAGPASAAFGLQPTLVGMSVIGIAVAAAIVCVPAVRTLQRPPAALP